MTFGSSMIALQSLSGVARWGNNACCPDSGLCCFICVLKDSVS